VSIELVTERLKDQIDGVLGCWDRVLIFGTLPKICYAEGMTSYLYAKQVRIFDYPRFAEPFRDRLRENAERLAAAAGLEIEFLRKRNARKEDLVKEALAKRGEQPGLVCVLSAMEPCSTYKPWHDKATGKTFLRTMASACTTISISSTKSWGCATFEYPPGCLAVCRSTSTATTGWAPSCAGRRSRTH
jgi:hypothetical protein